MSQKIIRIGTRGSALALAQAQEIKKKLKTRYPKTRFQIVPIKTAGDEFQSVELFKTTQTGVFTKRIEKKLMKGQIDIAVHSLKDLPADLPAGLRLAAFPKRADIRDVLISKQRHNWMSLPQGARVGTGSPRRKRQMLLLRPDLTLEDIRGNLDTRIRKVLKEKKYDAVVLARAGLKRLGKYSEYAHALPPSLMLPAVGQGALGLEIRRSDRDTFKTLRFMNDPATERAVLAERVFLKTLRGGCRVPVGIYSRIKGAKMRLKAAVFSVKSCHFISEEISGFSKNYKSLAQTLARRLLKMGARKFLKEARSHAP